MKDFLNARGMAPGIGIETGKPPKSGNGIARYKSKHGSTRYVLYVDGRAISVLQVVSRDSKHALIANVYTDPEYRRQGWASRLLQRAKRDFKSVAHAKESMLSDDAKHWIGSPLKSDLRKFLKPE